MIIKLTNATEEYRGKKVLINSDRILSVFDGTNDSGEKITFVYVDKENIWHVSETIEQIYKMVCK
jgi:hypothetical protein